MLCPNDKRHDTIAVEYGLLDKDHYDGVSEIWCRTEGKTFGRWCMQELKSGERENVFCDGKKSHSRKEENVKQKFKMGGN